MERMLTWMCCAVACEGVPCVVEWGCVGWERGGAGSVVLAWYMILPYGGGGEG